MRKVAATFSGLVVLLGGILTGCVDGPKDERGRSDGWDFDGDGYADQVIREHNDVLLVFPGDSDGLATKQKHRVDPSSTPGFPAKNLDNIVIPRYGSGDVDGDGYDDLVVCVEYHTVREEKGGFRWRKPVALFGGPDGLSSATQVGGDGIRSCYDVAVGDMSGDDRADIVLATDTGVWRTAVSREARAEGQWSFAQVDQARREGDIRWNEFRDLTVGDVNGDGHADLAYAVAANPVDPLRVETNPVDKSAVRVRHGGEDGLTPGGDVEYCCGSSPRFGDVTGDGLDDLLVRDSKSGRFDMWQGSDHGLDLDAAPRKWLPDLIGSYDRFAVTDVDGDRAADIVLRVDDIPGQVLAAGVVRIVPSTPDGPRLADAYLTTPSRTLINNEVESPSWATMRGHDVTGDGRSELLVSGAWESRHQVSSIEGRDLQAPRRPEGRPTRKPEPNTERARPWDLDGDGHSMLVSGELSGHVRGTIFGFPGSRSGPASTGSVLLASGSDAEVDALKKVRHFGGEIASGDFDGDGHADLAACAAYREFDGMLVVAFGSESGLTDHRTMTGRCESLAVGDADGDGYDDLALQAGATMWARGGPDVRSTGWDFEPLALFQEGNGLSFGDLDGDGYQDLVSSSMHYAGDGGDRALVAWGGPDGLRLGEAIGTDMEFTRVAVGDLDGDGYDDVAIAEQNDRVLVRFGSGDGLDGQRKPVVLTPDDLGLSTQAGKTWFGADVAIGDSDGDGDGDLAIGVPDADSGGAESAGAVVVVPGSGTGPALDGSRILRQGSDEIPGPSGKPEAEDRFGESVEYRSLVGDRAQLLVSVPGEDDDEGKVHLIDQDSATQFHPGDVD